MKIINIVENLDRGAVENWLVRVFVESRKTWPDWEWTFYCILGKKGRLDELVINFGGKIVYAPVTISKKVAFLKHLRLTLQIGKFDIIHSHHDYLSGFYLLSTIGIKFKKRILHIHNTDKGLPVGSARIRNMLLTPFKFLCYYFNDIIVGISKDTLKEFVGNFPSFNTQTKVLYYGIDLKEYYKNVNKDELREQLNLPIKSKLLLFVGRMNDLKNPVFVVNILSNILLKRKDVYALFVGKGDLEDDVIKQAIKLNVFENIRMLGWRNDICDLFKSCDIFIFPRIEYPREGLGLVIVEAQAAGIPMLISRGVVSDAIEIEELASFLPLNDNADQWSDKALEMLQKTPPYSQEDALKIMLKSKFELGTASQNLISLYE